MTCKCLTDKQRKILEYIRAYFKKNGYEPSYIEIRDEFNFKAHSTSQFHTATLIKKGFLKRRGGRGYILII